MFGNKIKNKEKNANDLIGEKFFSKDNIIYNKLANRSLSFFKKEYSSNLTISLVFSIISCFFIAWGTIAIEMKNSEHKVYLTNVNGQTEKYNANTEERIKTGREAKEYRMKRN